jgi:hypothetical protein
MVTSADEPEHALDADLRHSRGHAASSSIALVEQVIHPIGRLAA